MKYKKDILGFFMIRAGILLQLAGVTIWKISSYFSQDTIWYTYIILIAAIMGFFMFCNGGTRLLTQCGSDKGREWDDYVSRAIKIMAITLALLFVFTLFYATSSYMHNIWTLEDKLTLLLGRGGGIIYFFTFVFVCVDVAIYSIVWGFLRCLRLKRIGYQFIWLLYIAGFTYILLVFTGDSRATPIENAVISVVFLGAHWYIGGALLAALNKLEYAIKQDGQPCFIEGMEQEEKEETVLVGWKKAISLKGKVVSVSCAFILVISGAMSIIRYSSEKDFVCYPYNHGVILGKYIGDRRQVRVPDKIGGRTVLGLVNSFSDNGFVKEVKLPDSIKVLGNFAFSRTANLKRINLPKNLEYIGEYCFYSSGLSQLDQGDAEVQLVGALAFSGTPWRYEQSQDKDMICIGNNLIYYNVQGENVRMPDGPKVIMEGAFKGGEEKVREIYLPASLEIVGDMTFSEFYSLTDIHIPESVRYISRDALPHDTEEVVIWGKKGSFAEKMAQESGLLFCEEGKTRPVTSKDSAWYLGDMLICQEEENVCVVYPRKDLAAVRGILGNKYIVIQPDDYDISNQRLEEGYTYPYGTDIQVNDIELKKTIKTYSNEELKNFLMERGAIDGDRYELKTGSIDGCYQNNDENFVYLELKEKDKFLLINIDADKMDVIDYDELLEIAYQYPSEVLDYNSKLEPILSYGDYWENGKSILHANGFGNLSEYDFHESGKVLQIDSYFDVKGDQRGIAEILTLSSSLPEQNEGLYEMFPSLKEVGREDEKIVMLHLGGYPKAEELLKLFMEDGEEISFQDCMLSAEYSYDGMPYPINSFDEYYRYKNKNK